jgi:hypothetical protein
MPMGQPSQPILLFHAYPSDFAVSSAVVVVYNRISSKVKSLYVNFHALKIRKGARTCFIKNKTSLFLPTWLLKELVYMWERVTEKRFYQLSHQLASQETYFLHSNMSMAITCFKQLKEHSSINYNNLITKFFGCCL